MLLFASAGLAQQQPVQVLQGTMQEVPATVIANPATGQTMVVNPVNLNVSPQVVGPSQQLQQFRSGLVSTVPQQSGPVCGGVVNGRPQPPCANKPARFESKAVGTCPQGSFFDLGLWQCWSCPAGFHRTAHAVTDERACAIADPSVRGEFAPATFKGPICPAGTFYDGIRGGECWSCPSGFRRSVFGIDDPKACHQPASERLFPATRHKSTPWPHECTGGTFFDIYNGGGCYSCPGGWRTAHHITRGDACASQIPEQYSRATPHKKGVCAPGEIHDGRNGGECWSCPATWARTVFPIHENRACEKAGGERFAKANYVSALTCPKGQIFDLVDGGTCWTCPPGYTRGVDHIKSGGACMAGTIDWFTAPYKHPGLFGLAGGEAAALETLREDRAVVEEAIAAMAEKTGQPLATFRPLAWKEIVEDPTTSSFLRAAVLGRMVQVIQGQKPATPAMQQLIASFEEYIRAYRTYLANDALKAYDAWKVADQFWKSQRSGPQNMGILFDLGVVPPDFQEIVNAASWSGLAAGGGVGTIGVLALGTEAGKKAVFPFAYKAAKMAADAAAKVATEGAVKATEAVVQGSIKASAKLGSQIGKSVADALSKGSGPLMIVTIAAEILALAIEHVVEVNNARPRLVTAIADAGQRVDFRRLLATDEGTNQILGLWGLAVTGETQPTQAWKQQVAALAPAAQPAQQVASVQQAPAQQAPVANADGWIRMPGAGVDIAIGADGSLWALGTAAADANGYEIYRMQNNNWVRVQGAGTRLAVEPKGNAWHINRRGDIYRWDGAKWIRVPGPAGVGASDIAIGLSGKVWILGNKPEGREFGIYRLDGSSWVKVPGGGVRITVDSIGNAAVVSSAGDIFHYNGSAWTQIPGKARDIAFGPGGHVWALSMAKATQWGYAPLRWDGARWVTHGGALTEITVARDGKPLGISDGGGIWRLQ